MDQPHDTTLLAALTHVPDPGCARGQRYPWRHVRRSLAAAHATPHQSARALAQLAPLHVEVSYGITSLTAEEAGAADVDRLWRGHWTIEDGKHYVRDVTLGEDRHQMYSGNAPQVLAALRNVLINM